MADKPPRNVVPIRKGQGCGDMGPAPAVRPSATSAATLALARVLYSAAPGAGRPEGGPIAPVFILQAEAFADSPELTQTLLDAIVLVAAERMEDGT